MSQCVLGRAASLGHVSTHTHVATTRLYDLLLVALSLFLSRLPLSRTWCCVCVYQPHQPPISLSLGHGRSGPAPAFSSSLSAASLFTLLASFYPLPQQTRMTTKRQHPRCATGENLDFHQTHRERHRGQKKKEILYRWDPILSPRVPISHDSVPPFFLSLSSIPVRHCNNLHLPLSLFSLCGREGGLVSRKKPLLLFLLSLPWKRPSLSLFQTDGQTTNHSLLSLSWAFSARGGGKVQMCVFERNGPMRQSQDKCS